MATPDHSCQACGNSTDDLCTWEGVDWCDCCEQYLCDRCYGFMHWMDDPLHVQA